MNCYRAIYRKIRKFNTIVIARHVGPDPDALASSLALGEIIRHTFPHKKVYVVGSPASKFKFLGSLDHPTEEMYEKSLLIVTDTPDKKRVDGVDLDRFEYRIKIDHHPFIEKFAELEWIDDQASSASQMIMELVFHTPLKMTKKAAEQLYIGLIADTNRFMYYYSTSKTFALVSKLLKTTNIDFTTLYEPLYLRSIKEVRFQGYIADHLTITENGLGYIQLTDEVLKEYGMDASTANKMVESFNYIEEIIVWVFLSYAKGVDMIKGSIRSRGPVINDIASHYNGGGHAMASGVRIKEQESVDHLIRELDQACLEYRKGK